MNLDEVLQAANISCQIMLCENVLFAADVFAAIMATLYYNSFNVTQTLCVVFERYYMNYTRGAFNFNSCFYNVKIIEQSSN